MLLDAPYNYTGDTYASDHDVAIWFLTYDVDPEYTKLFTQQEIVWEPSPYLIFAYPYQLEACRGDKWTGVVPSPPGSRPSFFR